MYLLCKSLEKFRSAQKNQTSKAFAEAGTREMFTFVSQPGICLRRKLICGDGLSCVSVGICHLIGISSKPRLDLFIRVVVYYLKN